MKYSRARKLAVSFVSLLLLFGGAFVVLFDQSSPVPVMAPHAAPRVPRDPLPRSALSPGLLAATAVSVQENPRRLMLVETYPGRTPHEGSALLGTDPRAPQRYRAGGILLNGARLTEIHNQYVILERGGGRLRLDMAGSPTRAVASGAADLAIVGGARPVPAAPAVAIDAFSRVLRISPVFENEALAGVRLFPGTRPALFTQLGLLRDDLLIAVDGYPIMEASQMTAMLEPLSRGARMVFTVRRNSGPQDVVLDGTLIARAIESEALGESPLPQPAG